MKIANPIASDFGKKLFKGTFLLAFGSIFSRAMLSVSFIILARILTTEEYGEYGILKSTVDNFLIFASMGIGLTTTKYVSELKNTDKQGASSILGTALICVLLSGIFISLILSIFSGYIATDILNKGSLGTSLAIASFVLVLTAFNATQLGALLGLQSYKMISIANITQGIALVVGLVVGGYYGKVMGVILGNLIALLVTSIVIQYLLRFECRKVSMTISLKNWKQNLRKIYKFAIPASLSSFITAPTIWVLNTMLVNQENGYYELGIYTAVIIFSTAIQMLNGSISNVLLPIFLAKETNITPKKEFFNYFGAWYISIFLSLPLILFPELVTLVLGSKYTLEIIKPILFLSIISTLIITNRQGIGRDLIIKGKMWLSVFSMGQWAITSLIIFYFLKPLGAIGFASAYCLGYVLNLFLFVPFFIHLKISPSSLFYNLKVWIIWLLLLALLLVNLSISMVFTRIIISIIVVFFLLLILYRLYESFIQKNN